MFQQRNRTYLVLKCRKYDFWEPTRNWPNCGWIVSQLIILFTFSWWTLIELKKTSHEMFLWDETLPYQWQPDEHFWNVVKHCRSSYGDQTDQLLMQPDELLINQVLPFSNLQQGNQPLMSSVINLSHVYLSFSLHVTWSPQKPLPKKFFSKSTRKNLFPNNFSLAGKRYLKNGKQ